MQINHFVLGEFETNSYVISDENTGVCAIIDPADNVEVFVTYIESNNLHPEAVLLTHSHFDHLLAVPDLRKRWPDLRVYCHEADWVTDETEEFEGRLYPTLAVCGEITHYGEGDIVNIGDLECTVYHTTGHSEGSVLLQVENVIFTGDTIFKTSMGSVEYPGGDIEKLLKSLARLALFNGDYKLLPGHEGLTTLDYERKYNPCIHEALRRYGN